MHLSYLVGLGCFRLIRTFFTMPFSYHVMLLHGNYYFELTHFFFLLSEGSVVLYLGLALDSTRLMVVSNGGKGQSLAFYLP